MPEGRAGLARLVALLLAVVATLWIGVRAAQPPAALPASAPLTTFSATRAMTDVRAIAVRPHPSGSADLARVRAYLARRLGALGVRTEERHYLLDPRGFATLSRWNPRADPGGELVDLVGVLPGRDRARPAVALMAHMDTVWGSPGGADDSAGVAAILEVLRAIRARGTPLRDIVVVLTDGEELGLSGARAFWPSDGLAAHVGVVLNLESRGAGGRAAMFETGDHNGAMVRLFAASVRRPVANSMAVLAYRLMPNSTDFNAVRARGLPGFNFAMLGGPAYYHSPRATADRLDSRTEQDLCDQVLDLTAALASAGALPVPAPDAVFFDIAGHRVRAYSAGGGWLVLLAAAAALGLAWAGAARQRLVDGRAAGQGALALAWLGCNAFLLLTWLNRVSAGGHQNYYDRLAALPGLEWQAALACLAALGGWVVLRRLPARWMGVLPGLVLALLCCLAGAPRGLALGLGAVAIIAGIAAPREGVTRWGGWIGALAAMLLAAAIVQAKAPMAAWILAWPVLAIAGGAAAIAWTDPRFARPGSWVVAALAATLASAPLLPLAHLMFLGVGAPMPQAMLIFLLPIAAAFWPLVRVERAGAEHLVLVALLMVAALGVALHLRHAPLAPTVPAYSLS